MPLESDAHLANDLPKAWLLAHILALIKGSPGSQREMDLFRAICVRYPGLDGLLDSRRWFFIFCGCHLCGLPEDQVSSWGFVLLEEIQATLGKQRMLILEVDLILSSLSGPFFGPFWPY